MLPTSKTEIISSATPTGYQTPIHIHCPGDPSCSPFKPTITPTNTPDIASIGNVSDGGFGRSDLVWVSLRAVGLKLQMPTDWHITETPAQDYCKLGHLLADYDITSDKGDFLKLHFACQVYDQNLAASCADLTVLDGSRAIGREKPFGVPPTYYTYYFKDYTGNLDCPTFGWQLAGMNVSGIYYNRLTFEDNYPPVDAIMLSIQEP